MQRLPDMIGLLHSALRAKWLRGALIALLLVAQHGALTHALLHAGWQAHGGVARLDVSAEQLAQNDGAPANQATKSCAFDPVYSQVLGGVFVAVSGFQVPAGIFDSLTWHGCARVFAEAPPFLAQAPPAFL